MLGLLCPECSIVKYPPPPCIRSTRLYSCILQNNYDVLGIFAARKMFWVDIVSFSLVKNLYFYMVMSTFVLHTLTCTCLTFIGRPFTVENSPWKKRDQPRSQGLRGETVTKTLVKFVLSFQNFGGKNRMRSACCKTVEYGCVSLRMRFFSQNFGMIKEFYQGLRHRLTAKTLGPRLKRDILAWAMFRQHDSWIISNIIFEAHPER